MSQSLALLYGLFTAVGGMASYMTRGQVVNLVSSLGLGSAYFGAAHLIKRGDLHGYDIAFGASTAALGWSLYWFRKYGRYRQGAQVALFLFPSCYYGYLTVLHHRGLIRRPLREPEEKRYF